MTAINGMQYTAIFLFGFAFGLHISALYIGPKESYMYVLEQRNNLFMFLSRALVNLATHGSTSVVQQMLNVAATCSTE